MSLRIGSVPYLNAKPLVDWFHSEDCDADVEMVYEVPSKLAHLLRAREIDVANVSVFEALQNPEMVILPRISISAYGPVKSVRLFSKRPLSELRTVALDSSSLTSAALTRILLAERFGVKPSFVPHPPQLDAMLARHDAALIIGDLRLFELLPGTSVNDLGQEWLDLTGLPFVYACWIAPQERASSEMVAILEKAKQWGLTHLETLATKWAQHLQLPLERCRDYLLCVMNYHLEPLQLEGLMAYQRLCYAHGLLSDCTPPRFFQE